MFNKIFISICLIFLACETFASATAISGNVPGGEGLEIRLLAGSDQITNYEIILDRTIIDSTGYFRLMCDINDITYSQLDLDYYNGAIYLEPGNSYNLLFDTIHSEGQYRPFYEKNFLSFQIVPYDLSELNELISTFNQFYNEFITENFELIYKRRKTKLIEIFRHEMDVKFKDHSNQYFADYISYKIASVELSVFASGKSELFTKYLQSKPVQYAHVEYMNFFNSFFDHYLTSGSRDIRFSDLKKSINQQNSYFDLMEVLGRDTLLINERIRELVMLKGLKEMFYMPDYSSENVLNILSQVQSFSPYPEHRSIAATLAKSLNHLHKGSSAPAFRLPDLKGDYFSHEDFYGKPVYLSFLTTWTYACLAEYKILDSLYTKYGAEINFVTISLDKDAEVIGRFVKEKKYNWKFLYNGTGYDLIHDYGIKTFPLFVLISKDGKILQYPANKPSEGIEEFFLSMDQKK